MDLAVDLNPTVTVLASSVNPATAGRNMALTATVSGHQPGGTVEFIAGNTVLGRAPLDAAGQVVWVTAFTRGGHEIRAAYLGDPINAPSVSEPLLQSIDTESHNPEDHGSPDQYARQIYVDNTYPRCEEPEEGCGSQLRPYTNLQKAINQIVPVAGGSIPRTEVIIAGHAGFPYYSWMNFPTWAADPQSTGPQVLIRPWAGVGMDVPVVRGTVPIQDWVLVDASQNLYSTAWDRLDERGGVLYPQQVYRENNLTPYSQQLTQVGGLVYGGYPQQVPADFVVDGAVLADIWPGRISHVDETQLFENEFYFKPEEKTIYVRLPSPLEAGEALEVSERHFLVANSQAVHGLTIKGIVFERSNTSHYPRGGAIFLKGDHINLDGITVQDTDSHCVHLVGAFNTLQNSTIQRCGHVGLVANGPPEVDGVAQDSNLTVRHNKFFRANTRGFRSSWEAGAIKIISSPRINGAVFDGNVIAYNNGPGLWLDTRIDRNVIVNNVVAFNDGIGIYLEISSGNQVFNNQVFGNLYQGMQIRGANTEVRNNLFAANRMSGIDMPWDERPLLEGDDFYFLRNNYVFGNRFAWNYEYTATHALNPGTQLNYFYDGEAEQASSFVNGNKYCGTYAKVSKLSSPFVMYKNQKLWTQIATQSSRDYRFDIRNDFGNLWVGAWRFDTEPPASNWRAVPDPFGVGLAADQLWARDLLRSMLYRSQTSAAALRKASTPGEAVSSLSQLDDEINRYCSQ